MNRLTNLITPLAVLALTGCASTDLELGAPTLEASLVLDKASYQVGEVVVATLTVENTGEKTSSLPIPSIHSLDFYRKPDSSPDSLAVSFLDIPSDAPEFVALEPGEQMTRTLVLPLATKDSGSFGFYAVYRSELSEEFDAFLPVATPSIPVDVSGPALWQRDDEGRITGVEAERLAQSFFGGSATKVDTQLIRDNMFRLDRWWCTVHFAQPDASGRSTRSCLVNPYLPAVHIETDETVPGRAVAKR